MRTILAVVSLLLIAGGASASERAKSPWIHVKVVEDKAGGAKVNINLPLSLVRVAVDVADDGSTIPAHIDIESSDISVTDLRRMWKELRDSGDAELVEIEDDGEHIQVRRRGDTVYVTVRKVESKQATVNIELPVRLIDALLEGEGPSLNLRGALARLDDGFRGDLVRVEDGETTVRVWVD